ncbi:hypothetical protein C7I55_11915 [Sphingomonas deserti]|uniref:Uncharacterized protein n=1 Tax=Allosphingosinicella deserti TaxID=2116704 RepID=A0A2P7QSQ1_9SPHN|nr:hypothetical protein C7I55_11915 [Sphingomonas deserti]
MAQAQSDADLLAPLVPSESATADDDLLAPLTPPPSDDDLLAPLTPPPSDDDDLLAPLTPPPSDDDDLLAPLTPPPSDDDDLLAPLTQSRPAKPRIPPKDLSEEELIAEGAKMIRSMDASEIARSIEWAGSEMDKAMKTMPKADLQKAIRAVEAMDGMDNLIDAGAGAGGAASGGGEFPIPLEIDMAEQAEWERRQRESNGTLVLIERPYEVMDCRNDDGADVCILKRKIRYELAPVRPASAP